MDRPGEETVLKETSRNLLHVLFSIYGRGRAVDEITSLFNPVSFLWPPVDMMHSYNKLKLAVVI